jgi:hypothetical protein
VFSPIANLLLVPASFVMQLAGTALLFVGFSPGVAGLLGSALDGYTKLYLGCVKALAQSSVNIAAASPNGWLMAAYGVLAMAFSPSVLRAKPRLRAAMAVALAVMAVFLLTPFSQALSFPSDAVVLSESGGLSLFWQENGRSYVACGGEWSTAQQYLSTRGITELAGLYFLDSAPPASGTFSTGSIHVQRLYVPGRWLKDHDAAIFLNMAMAMNMEPAAAQDGPYGFEDYGSSAVLTVAAAGRRIAFVPYALKEDFPQVTQQASGAGFVALNIPANRAGPLLSLGGIKTVALPGGVADAQVTVYNMKKCGSLALQKQRELPWIGEWADGIQGNFR